MFNHKKRKLNFLKVVSIYCTLVPKFLSQAPMNRCAFLEKLDVLELDKLVSLFFIFQIMLCLAWIWGDIGTSLMLEQVCVGVMYWYLHFLVLSQSGSPSTSSKSHSHRLALFICAFQWVLAFSQRQAGINCQALGRGTSKASFCFLSCDLVYRGINKPARDITLSTQPLRLFSSSFLPSYTSSCFQTLVYSTFCRETRKTTTTPSMVPSGLGYVYTAW